MNYAYSMKKALTTTFLILCSASAALCCGEQRDIRGRGIRDIGGGMVVGVYAARVRLFYDLDGEKGIEVGETMTNPFGHYSFPEVSSCRLYIVMIEHKWFEWQQAEVLIYVSDRDKVTLVDFEVGTPGT